MENNTSKKSGGLSLPIAAAIAVGIANGLVSGGSFEIIKYWPLPASVVPALTFGQGFVWGAVIGAVSGLVIGFCTDDRHFSSPES